jgi:hypothetical protein
MWYVTTRQWYGESVVSKWLAVGCKDIAMYHANEERLSLALLLLADVSAPEDMTEEIGLSSIGSNRD